MTVALMQSPSKLRAKARGSRNIPIEFVEDRGDRSVPVRPGSPRIFSESIDPWPVNIPALVALSDLVAAARPKPEVVKYPKSRRAGTWCEKPVTE